MFKTLKEGYDHAAKLSVSDTKCLIMAFGWVTIPEKTREEWRQEFNKSLDENTKLQERVATVRQAREWRQRAYNAGRDARSQQVLFVSAGAENLALKTVTAINRLIFGPKDP